MKLRLDHYCTWAIEPVSLCAQLSIKSAKAPLYSTPAISALITTPAHSRSCISHGMVICVYRCCREIACPGLTLQLTSQKTYSCEAYEQIYRSASLGIKQTDRTLLEWGCPFFAVVNLLRLPVLEILSIKNQSLRGSLACQTLSRLELTYDPEICKLTDRSKAAADTFADLPGVQELYLRLIRPALQVGPLLKTTAEVFNPVGGDLWRIAWYLNAYVMSTVSAKLECLRWGSTSWKKVWHKTSSPVEKEVSAYVSGALSIWLHLILNFRLSNFPYHSLSLPYLFCVGLRP